MAYTQHDTPAIVARVSSDLTRAVALVREADPRLRSLVLTGGFARGEGSVLHGAPQNDYDLVAIRDFGPPRTPYARLQVELQRALGLHVDLAPVPAWRLAWTAPSIFWYETALTGRVLWGESLLHRVPVRDAARLHPGEGMRLLVNRAAGLLLVTQASDPAAHRLQAAKAILAAMDVRVLAAGRFVPGQAKRWVRYQQLIAAQGSDASQGRSNSWTAWAFSFKMDPETTPVVDARLAWQAARRAVLGALPVALRHAGLPDLSSYARRERWVDRLHYFRHAILVPGAPRLVSNPTGRVRAATLAILEASVEPKVRDSDVTRLLAGLGDAHDRPLRLLEALRGATLQ